MNIKELLSTIMVIICFGFLYWKFDNNIVTMGILFVSSVCAVYKIIKKILK